MTFTFQLNAIPFNPIPFDYTETDNPLTAEC